ncbi:hypothetical protein [Streptomyces sp. SID3343]|uniref:hypothetical protein n=1 Tax=Streptomyces sp. SID3343 TaxID=2690260 RepID=UPI0013684844|nr:hypothetical protein [Streptomyces sp. SID3343]MYW00172.1 hypothetical protein [Streptomyces sp. SID3343]
MSRLRRWYGAGPLHLLALAACFTLAWYAGTRLLTYEPARVVLWFVGAAVVHDLVLYPLYSAADRTGQAAAGAVRRGRGRGRPERARAAIGLNHVRFPAALSALLFLVWLPQILGLADGYDLTTGLDGSRFLPRWLLITAFLFAASALVRAVRSTLRRVGRR